MEALLLNAPAAVGRPQWRSTVFMFSGQGSHYRQMGRDLFENHPGFRAKLRALDRRIGALGGESVIEKLYGIEATSAAPFDNTLHTNPAIFAIQHALAEVMLEAGITPDCVVGSSLGEWVAAVVSGALSLDEGLQFVLEQAFIFHEECPAAGMTAVLGAPSLFEELDLARARVEIAAFNYPGQFVIAGLLEDLDQAERRLLERGVCLQRLPVSRAFHTRFIDPARERFLARCRALVFRAPCAEYLSCTAAASMKQLSAEHFWSVVREPIRFAFTIIGLERSGPHSYLDLGPGGTLRTFLKYCLPEKSGSSAKSVLSPYGKESGRVAELVAQYKESRLDSPPLETEARPLRGSAAIVGSTALTAERLGSAEFLRDYNVRQAYVAGAMYSGIASVELVTRLAKAGYLSFFGAGGLSLEQIERALQRLERENGPGASYGMNLLCRPGQPHREMAVVELYLKYRVRVIEAAAFMQITQALALYRARGMRLEKNGRAVADNKVIAKVSRPEVAQAFLEPPPAKLLQDLEAQGLITSAQARAAALMPVADDLCVESDSGGHTDMGVMTTLLPTIRRLRETIGARYPAAARVRVGAAGGIGTPEAAAAAFLMGADFVCTGSINQCTVEAGTSELVKDMLQQASVQDMDYAPAGDLFEMGAKVQVLKRGVLFPARARKLHELWRTHRSIDDLDRATAQQLEEKYFRRGLAQVYAETEAHYLQVAPAEIERARDNASYKMALIFKSYFAQSTRAALAGDASRKVDFQIQCGPALGAFNEWVKGTDLESWRQRHVDLVAQRLMDQTARYLSHRIAALYA